MSAASEATRAAEANEAALAAEAAAVAHAKASAAHSPRLHEMPPDWDFRVLRIRRGQPSLNLAEYVESVEWSDEGQVNGGSLSLRKPDVNRNWLPVTRGDLVRVDAWVAKRWRQLVTMRVEGFPESDTGEGTLTMNLSDDLALLTRQKRDWLYRKTAKGKHSKGWYPGEIARDVARKEGLRVGKIHRGQHRIAKLEKKDTHGLDVIFAAYAKERAKTGKLYLTRIRDGRLEIQPYRRSVAIYVLNEVIEAAAISRRVQSRTTVLTGKGRIGKSAKARKVKFRYKRQAIVRRYGLVEQEKDYGKVDSMADLRRQVKSDYAEMIKVHKTGSITVTGMPFLRGSLGNLGKGQGIIVLLRAEGMVRGKSTRFWTTSVRHTVDGSSYTTAIDFEDEDPWTAYQEDQDKFAREQKRKQRNK